MHTYTHDNFLLLSLLRSYHFQPTDIRNHNKHTERNRANEDDKKKKKQEQLRLQLHFYRFQKQHKVCYTSIVKFHNSGS